MRLRPRSKYAADVEKCNARDRLGGQYYISNKKNEGLNRRTIQQLSL
jgi:hypothetical protein